MKVTCISKAIDEWKCLYFQAKPMLNFQTDYDEATGEQVLTCFLLPQMDYQVEQGELYFYVFSIKVVFLYSLLWFPHQNTDSVHLGRMARSKCIEFQNGMLRNADRNEDSGYGILLF